MVARTANSIWLDTPTTESTDDSAPVVVAQTYSANQTVIVNVPTVGGPFVDSKGNTYPPGSIQTAKHPTGGVIQAGADITVAEFLMIEVATGASNSGGVGDFISLSDTPNVLGEAGETIAVNAARDGFEFVPVPASGSAIEREVFTANRDQTVVFGDLNFMCPSSGGSSLMMRRGSSPSMTITHFATHWSNQQGAASEQTPTFTVSTSWRKFRSANLNLTQHNNYQTGTFVCNGWFYEISVYVGSGWTSNRFVCTRWRLESLKGDAGAAGTDGTDGKGIVTAHRSDGATAIGGTIYTLDHVIYEFTDGTFQDMGFLVAPSAAGITTVELGSYSGSSTTGQTFTLPGGRTWQDVLDEFQFVYVMVGGNNLFSHDQSTQFHVSDLGAPSRDMAITGYMTHGSNAYHYRLATPAASSTTVAVNNDGSTMSVQRIKVIGIK